MLNTPPTLVPQTASRRAITKGPCLSPLHISTGFNRDAPTQPPRSSQGKNKHQPKSNPQPPLHSIKKQKGID
ncbi:hypothetical protein VTL71DRAFT_3236 [Oculimacula yallundae]|uniref:Uncharacterized protein n=1 Tax=Oculimacula yallundae TaxID=86028 RepID=A0ABR4C8E4_9HELO